MKITDWKTSRFFVSTRTNGINLLFADAVGANNYTLDTTTHQWSTTSMDASLRGGGSWSSHSDGSLHFRRETELRTSTDNGQSWETRSTPDRVTGLQMLDATIGYAAAPRIDPAGKAPGQSETLWNTQDGGKTWQPLGQLPTMARFFYAPSLGKIVVVTREDAIYYSGDNGQTWSLEYKREHKTE